MDAEKRILLAVRGGVGCAILGSLLGGCAVVLISAVRGSFGLAALSLIPMAVLYAAVTGAPFGFVAGAAGTWLVAARARHISGRRLYLEAACGGAVLGATYPLVLTISGWGPFQNLVSVLPISIGAGAICGIVLVPEVRRYLRALP
ncbi:MAG: hypothetical protein WCD47_15205 [Candidatus Sulfotelmatobacter sp.]